MKVCTKCKINKEDSAFYFIKAKNRKATYKNSCKECDKIYKKSIDEQCRMRTKIVITNKVCTGCKKNKEINAFCKLDISSDGYTTRCKACKLSWNKIYKQKNKEHFNKLRNLRLKLHPERRLVQQQNREAKKRNTGGRGIKAKEWLSIKKLYGNVCICCGTPEKISMDHVIPIFKGGRHEPENIQPLCISCNVKKFTAIIDFRPNFNFHEEVVSDSNSTLFSINN